MWACEGTVLNNKHSGETVSHCMDTVDLISSDTVNSISSGTVKKRF